MRPRGPRVGFWARARTWLAAHGITRITRVVTDNGSCYRSTAFARATGHAGRHQLIKPFTPKHNGKVCEDLAWRCTGRV